jgi:hypothetical protein
MNFVEVITKDIVADTFCSFAEQVEADPRGTLHQVESVLKSLYVRYGNDWTGRGIVGDSTQEAAIAGLEAVRAECLARIENGTKQ